MNWLVETAATKSNHQFTVHRYMDDLFLTFDDPNHIDHVFSTFNSIHQKIKFTKENEVNNKLAFLDVQIPKNSDCIGTSIFRKNTNLGIYTRWDSYVPNRYKQNLVWTLLQRAYSICNNAQLRKKIISKNFKPSREKWISLKLHKPANTTFSCQKAVEKIQNRQEGRPNTDFYETSLHKRNERPYTKRN